MCGSIFSGVKYAMKFSVNLFISLELTMQWLFQGIVDNIVVCTDERAQNILVLNTVAGGSST